jgi:hypothetical protein
VDSVSVDDVVGLLTRGLMDASGGADAREQLKRQFDAQAEDAIKLRHDTTAILSTL